MEEDLNLEKAQIIFKLARKHNWGNRYDRLEHFKRFKNLEMLIKELSRINWVIIHHKPKFIGISLNQEYKKEIITFIETNLHYIKGTIK